MIIPKANNKIMNNASTQLRASLPYKLFLVSVVAHDASIVVQQKAIPVNFFKFFICIFGVVINSESKFFRAKVQHFFFNLKFF
jgi:hypothetical protein